MPPPKTFTEILFGRSILTSVKLVFILG